MVLTFNLILTIHLTRNSDVIAFVQENKQEVISSNADEIWNMYQSMYPEDFNASVICVESKAMTFSLSLSDQKNKLLQQYIDIEDKIIKSYIEGRKIQAENAGGFNNYYEDPQYYKNNISDLYTKFVLPSLFNSMNEEPTVLKDFLQCRFPDEYEKIYDYFKDHNESLNLPEWQELSGAVFYTEE